MAGVSVLARVRSPSREPLPVDLSERIGDPGHADEVFQTYRYYSTVTIGTVDDTRFGGERVAASGRTALGRSGSLGSYLRQSREASGLSQDELVRRTGLSLSTIRKMEDGRTANPGVFTLLKVWRALDLAPDGLMRFHERNSD